MPQSSIYLPIDEAYDRWSSFYDRYDNPMVFGAGRIVHELAEHIAGQEVIEFGCGTGRNLERLSQRGAAKLIGCDLSPGMLQQARARDPNFVLFQHDMTQPMPLPDGSVDLILFSLTLEHVDDLVPPLREARRLLRSVGRIGVIEIHPFLSLGNVAAHFKDGEMVVRMPTFPHGFSDYINATAAANLSITACREWRPRDFQAPVPDKVLKRGPDIPLLVEFSLCQQHPDRPEQSSHRVRRVDP